MGNGTAEGGGVVAGTTEGDTGGLAERLAALERENADLRARLADAEAASSAPVTAASEPPGDDAVAGRRPRYRGRAAAAVVLVLVGALLAPAGAVAAWAERLLTDTDRYVATVGPLAAHPVLQSAIAGRLTQEVVSRIDVPALYGQVVEGLEDQGVPPRAVDALTALEAPLTSGVQSFVRRAADAVVTSQAFEDAWQEANRTAHEQLVAVMKGGRGDLLQIQDGQLTVQLAGMIDLLKERLVAGGLGIASNIPEVNASFAVMQAAELVQLQNRYAQVVALGTWLPWIALGLLAAGVLVARNKLRTLMVAGLALAAGMLVLGLALAVARGFYLNALDGVVLRLDAAEVVFDQGVGFLRASLRTVGVLGLVVALVAYLAGASASARSLRAGMASGFARARSWGDERGVGTGAFGAWLAQHRTFVRVVIVAGAALVLLLSAQPSVGLVVGTALVAGLLVAVVELLARPGRPATAEPDVLPSSV